MNTLEQKLANWNDDERDVKDLLYRDNPRTPVYIKPKRFQFQRQFPDDDDTVYCSYMKYTDRNLSWVDEYDSPADESNDVSSDQTSTSEEDLEIPSTTDDNDVIECMIYKKFCYT